MKLKKQIKTFKLPKNKLNKNKSVKSKECIKKTIKGKKIFKIFLYIYLAIFIIVSLWILDSFFLFYLSEKNPVLGLNTENSRMKNLEFLNNSKIQEGKNEIVKSNLGIKDLQIKQVGPSIHFYSVVNDDISVDVSRDIGKRELEIFSNFFNMPDMFNKYEAQLIITKENLPKLSNEELLRPIEQRNSTHEFPQYGVCNINIGGGNNNISWSRNGQ